MRRWHPWRHVEETYPEVDVVLKTLPPGVQGEWDGGTRITLDCDLSAVGRWCALTHEIIHMERGWAPVSAADAEVEELAVVDLTARRLLPMEDLVSAVRWGRGLLDCRDLDVLPSVLSTRVRGLTKSEHKQLAKATRGRAVAVVISPGLVWS